MSDYRLSSEETAEILVSQNLQPEPDQTNQQFQDRITQFVRNNPNLRQPDLDYFLQNKGQILSYFKKKLKIKLALVSIGHVAKWAKTTYSAIAICAAKLGQEGIKIGWAQLVKATAQTGTKQLIQNTLVRTLTSSTTWIIAAVVVGLQIGIQVYKLCKGEISWESFGKRCGKIIVRGAASTVGGAGGAALGAAIGSMLGPVGSICGIIIGGIVGGVCSSWAVNQGFQNTSWSQEGLKKVDQKYIYKQALDFFELPEKFTQSQLQQSRKAKYMLNHPDKWTDADEMTQNKKKQMLMKVIQYYQIIVNYTA